MSDIKEVKKLIKNLEEKYDNMEQNLTDILQQLAEIKVNNVPTTATKKKTAPRNRYHYNGKQAKADLNYYIKIIKEYGLATDLKTKWKTYAKNNNYNVKKPQPTQCSSFAQKVVWPELSDKSKDVIKKINEYLLSKNSEYLITDDDSFNDLIKNVDKESTSKSSSNTQDLDLDSDDEGTLTDSSE